MKDDRTATDTTATETDQRRIPVEREDVRADENVQASTAEADDVELLPEDQLAQLRGDWQRVQVLFVDEPRDAVAQAHDLVDRVIDCMTQRFAEQREGLMATWTRGDDVSTEDLRIALQRYRSFFNRLLST